MTEDINFGPYQKEPVTYHFKEAPDLWWKINPPLAENYLEREKFLRNSPEFMDIMLFEVSELFGGSNLSYKDGNPVFPEYMPPAMIAVKLGKSPFKFIYEIWLEIGRLYNDWGPADETIERIERILQNEGLYREVFGDDYE